MVMLFHGVDGAKVPPSISALYWTVVVWVKCSILFQSSPNFPPPSASAFIAFVSLVIGPPFTWRHSFTFFKPAAPVSMRVVTLSGLQVVPFGPVSVILNDDRDRAIPSASFGGLRCGSGLLSDLLVFTTGTHSTWISSWPLRFTSPPAKGESTS